MSTESEVMQQARAVREDVFHRQLDRTINKPTQQQAQAAKRAREAYIFEHGDHKPTDTVVPRWPR